MTSTTPEYPALPVRMRAIPARASWVIGMLALVIGLFLFVRSYATGQRVIENEEVGLWRVLLALMVLLPAPGFLSIGALIAIRGAGNTIGTLCSVLGLALSLYFCLDNAFWIDPGSPFSLWAALISHLGIQTALALIPVLITVFPTGRPPSRGWWAVGVVTGLAALWGLLFGLLQTTFWIDGYGSVMSPLADAINRLNVSPHDDWAFQLAEPASLVILLMLFASVGSVLARWRSADRIQRQQIKWLAAAVVLSLSVMISAGLVFGWEGLMLGLFTLMLGMPTSIAIAILRHRLYDVDFILRRTVTYAVASSTLSLIYVGANVVAQSVIGALGGQRNEVAIVASTLAVAALFSPVRGRVQNGIDRRFNRQRYDADKVVAEFAEFAARETDLAALSARIVGVVAETIQPKQVTVWVRGTPAHGSPVASDRPTTGVGANKREAQ